MVRLLFILMLLAAAPALAQWSADAEQCRQLAVAEGGADQRIEVCTRAIESGELSQMILADAYNNRGLAYVAKNDLDRALEDFNRSLKLNPEAASVLADRGMAFGLKDDYAAAVEDFSAAIELEPKFAGAYNGRCYTLAQMGEAARALQDCNRALALEPNTPYILDSRAYAYLRAGDFRRALADYDLILQIEPRNAPALYGRGIARLRLGRRQDGEMDLAAARAADSGIDAAMGKIGLAP